jgi:hypothetical protein
VGLFHFADQARRFSRHTDTAMIEAKDLAPLRPQLGKLIAGWANPIPALRLVVNPIIWAMIGFGSGIYFFFRGFAPLQRKRFIQNIPTSTIRGAALGLVEVSGKVEGPYTIIAPLSEQDCFYYRTVARQGGERIVVEETLSTPFFLDDGTGKLLVDGRGAETDLPPVLSENYADGVPDYLRHFLSRHGIDSGFPLTLEEFCIHPGDTLFVLGTLRENTAAEGIASAGPTPEAYLSADAADLQRRGEIEAEIPAAAALLAQPGHRSTARPSAEFDLHPPVILAGRGTKHPLFISGRSQRDIVRALGWQSTLYIWGGPVLTLACFWYLLSRLGYL